MTTLQVSKLEAPQARRTRTLTLAVRTVALVLAAFTLPISARAADVAGSKETIVRAIFERLDGCVLTTLEVLVVDERESVPPGGPVTGARIEAGIEQLDECSHEFLSSAFVIDALTDEEFHIDNKLESASVTKTVEMIDDILGTSFPVTIDLTWTATGPATRGRDRSFIRFEDEMFHSTEKFIVRDATASGSVVSGTTDFLDTLSLAGGDIVTRAVRFVGVVR